MEQMSRDNRHIGTKVHQSGIERPRTLGDYVMDDCGPVKLQLPRIPQGFNFMSPWLNDFQGGVGCDALKQPSELGSE